MPRLAWFSLCACRALSPARSCVSVGLSVSVSVCLRLLYVYCLLEFVAVVGLGVTCVCGGGVRGGVGDRGR